MSHDNKQVILARSAIDRCCHVCAFFHSRDDEYEVMLPFLKEGLDGGEKIIHIMDGRQKEERLRRLTETGVDAFRSRERRPVRSPALGERILD